MDILERRNRLRAVLVLEEDKEMLLGLKGWHSETNALYQADEEVQAEQAKKLLRKHFPNVVDDKQRRDRLSFVLGLLMGFEDTVVECDGITTEESGRIVQEVLDSIE